MIITSLGTKGKHIAKTYLEWEQASARRRRPLRPEFSCLRSETPGFYLRCLLIKHECHGRKLGCPRWLWGRKRENQRFRTARTLTFRGALGRSKYLALKNAICSIFQFHLLTFICIAFQFLRRAGKKAICLKVGLVLLIHLIRKWYYWDWVLFLLWSILDWLIMAQLIGQCLESVPILSHYQNVRK